MIIVTQHHSHMVLLITFVLMDYWVSFVSILYVIVGHRIFVISPIKPLQCILISHNNHIYTVTTEKILIELKHNTKVKFKETDLFRVYQSIDLVSVVWMCCVNVNNVWCVHIICLYAHIYLISTTPRLVIYHIFMTLYQSTIQIGQLTTKQRPSH